MKFILDDYEEGIASPIQVQLDAGELELSTVDLIYDDAVKLAGQAQKEFGSFHFWGKLESTAKRTCGRCLKEDAVSFKQNFDLYYPIEDCEEIETLDDLREALIIDRPMSQLCGEGCKGLCVHCGNDLNEQTCDCESSESIQTNSKFEALKNLDLKPKEE